MSRPNPILDGIRKHGDARKFFQSLKERAEGGGLTAREWEWYLARQREWEPEVLEAETREAERRDAMTRAATLSAEDLAAVLRGKTG
jgi:hypothetical protein